MKYTIFNYGLPCVRYFYIYNLRVVLAKRTLVNFHK